MKKVISVVLMAGLIVNSASISVFAAPTKGKQSKQKSVQTQGVTKHFIRRSPISNIEKDIQAKIKDANKKAEEKLKDSKKKAETKIKALKKQPIQKPKKHIIPPVIKIGKVVIPTTPIIKSLKANIIFNAKDKIVTISKNDVVIKVVEGSKIYVNDKLIDPKIYSKSKGSVIDFIKKTLIVKKQDVAETIEDKQEVTTDTTQEELTEENKETTSTEENKETTPTVSTEIVSESN